MRRNEYEYLIAVVDAPLDTTDVPVRVNDAAWEDGGWTPIKWDLHPDGRRVVVVLKRHRNDSLPAYHERVLEQCAHLQTFVREAAWGRYDDGGTFAHPPDAVAYARKQLIRLRSEAEFALEQGERLRKGE